MAEDWPLTPDAVFPRRGLGQEGFLTRLGGGGEAIKYSTWLGGDGVDVPMALAVDAGGGVWVAGGTTSIDFPQRHAPQQGRRGGQADAFVLCLSGGGRELAFSTLLGGAGADWLRALSLDAEGSALAGMTQGGPVRPGDSEERPPAGRPRTPGTGPRR